MTESLRGVQFELESLTATQHSLIDTKEQIINYFPFGFGNWLAHKASADVLKRLAMIDGQSLGREQFNQLLHLCHEPGVSDGFFRYYWLTSPDHPYEVTRVDQFMPSWIGRDAIQSLQHLRWGLYRLHVDSLLYFGDVRTAFRALRTKTEGELTYFFGAKRFDTDGLRRRGPALKLVAIAKDDRYLISEMACKSCATTNGGKSELENFLVDSYRAHKVLGGGRITVRNLLQQGFSKKLVPDRQTELLFSAVSILDEEINSDEELKQKFSGILASFAKAREAALKNTEYFLSMASDLDVYVATSMRDREDFRKMTDFCEQSFKDSAIRDLNIRYFDPTMSAAEGHEDKGLIECLMVKCAKVLVYCAGKKDSYGKDAEAAMALSQGKPVIFYCDEASRERFFGEVHPLSRLIDFKTGVPVGAMVTSSVAEVVELLRRIFENRMEYELEERAGGGLRLKEKLTSSVIRLQTGDRLLRETFRNYYHGSV